MGQFSTCDFIGTRTQFQRFSDSKLFSGWIQNFTLGSLQVHASADYLINKGDRLIFHVVSTHANARLVADFVSVKGLDLIPTSSIHLAGSSAANVVESPAANYCFKVVSQLEYLPPTEEARHMVGGWVVQVASPSGNFANAFLSDVSEAGAGILGPVAYQRGDIVSVHLDAMEKSLDLEAEIRYSVKSKIVPDMYKSGLKFREFGRLEGAVWRNFLKAA